MTNCFQVELSKKVAVSGSVLLIGLLCIGYESAEGVLVQTPSDKTIIANDSTFFNCSKSGDKSTELTWYHYTVDGKPYGVYEEKKIRDIYRGRFDMDKNLTSGTFNLLVQRPESTDAGRYACVEDPLDPGASAELVVMDSKLVCESDKDLNEIVGPTECTNPITPDQLQLLCSVIYSGNIPPQLEWRKVGSELQAHETNCGVRGNRIMCNATLEAKLNMDGSVYTCQITTAEQYNCSLKVNKTIYTFSDTTVRAITMKEEAMCSANTSKDLPCSYKWYKNNKTEQSGQTLKPSTPGLYTCEAECTIRNQTCAFTATVINVTESGTGNHKLLGFLVLPIILALAVLAYCIWEKKIKPQHSGNETEMDPVKVVVLVHSNVAANIPKLDQAEKEIVNLIYDILEGKPRAIAKHLLDIVLRMMEDGLNGARVEKSIVFFFQCKNLAQLKRLMDLMATKELQRNIELIYNEVLSTSTNVGVEITWDDAEFKKAESRLQEIEPSHSDVKMAVEPKEMEGPPQEQKPLLSDGSESNEMDEDNNIKQAFEDAPFIGRGLNGNIRGPGEYKGKQCAFGEILFTHDQQTRKDEEGMTDVEKVRRNGERWRTLTHDNLIKIHDVTLKSQVVYIVMEYTAGRSVRKELMKRTEDLPMSVVKDWATQVAQGLKYLHDNGIVHKNIKSTQIFIEEEPSDISIKTIKIGCINFLDIDSINQGTSLLQEQPYLSPETYRTGVHSKPSNVWSFSIVVWEILTRKLPYEHVKGADKITKDLENPNLCSEKLKGILIDCRIEEPSDRPTFTEIVDRLQEWQL